MGKVLRGRSAGEITVDEEAMEFRLCDVPVCPRAMPISLDGETGEVILGAVDTQPSEIVQVLLEKSPPARGVAALPVTSAA